MASYPFRYFAYGSNLHPERLGRRLDSPKLIGVAKLAEYRLTFHKLSNDGSGKCTIFQPEKRDYYVLGALYEISNDDKVVLDRIEGKGHGYQEYLVDVTMGDSALKSITYSAKSTHIDGSLIPYHWYKELVLVGATYLGFPDSYTSEIATVASMDDPKHHRRNENEQLIRELKLFSPLRGQ